MVTKKDLVIVVLATLCLILTLFTILPTHSSSSTAALEYDPWIDVNGDGKIDITDVAMTSGSFGTYGNSTKNVNVTNWPAQQNTVTHNDVYQWSTYIEGLAQGQLYYFSNATEGYSEMTLTVFSTGRDISVRVLTTGIDETWEIGFVYERVTRTFPLDGTQNVCVYIQNIDVLPIDANVSLTVTMSTWNSQFTMSRKYSTSSKWAVSLSPWQSYGLDSSVAGYDRYAVYVATWGINVNVTIVGSVQGMTFGWPNLDSFNVTSTQQAAYRVYQVNCEEIGVGVLNTGSTTGDCLIILYKTA